MKTGFVWKGIHSDEKGFKIISLPNITTPEKREEKIIIPGRSGYLTKSDDSYEGEIKPVEFDIKHDNFDDIKTWLNGAGEVTFSNEPDRYYKARIINKIDLERVLEKFHSGIVQFDCQPFGYLFSGQEKIEIDKTTEIYNEGTKESEPIFTIYTTGSYSFYCNEQKITINNINEHVTIDSEMMECHKDGISMNHEMVGDFPILKTGRNVINLVQYTPLMQITPRWRCR